MTALVGMLCRSGAVLGADRAVTTTVGGGRMPVTEAACCKIHIFDGGHVAMATSGNVGGGQLAIAALAPISDGSHAMTAKKWDEARLLREVRDHLQPFSSDFLRALHQLNPTGVPPPDYIADASHKEIGEGLYMRTVGDGTAQRPVLVNYEGGFRTDYLGGDRRYATGGSGAHYTSPFMRTLEALLFPGREPTLAEAALVVFWALQACIDTRAGQGVGQGIDLAVLEMDSKSRWKTRMLDANETEALEVRRVRIAGEMRTAFEKATAETTVPDLVKE